MKRHDVVVIGGSLAGAACVRELERSGIDAIAWSAITFRAEKYAAVSCLQALSNASAGWACWMMCSGPERSGCGPLAFEWVRLRPKFHSSVLALVFPAALWTKSWHAARGCSKAVW
jgi:L-2-hydroxyglutarate oxidase LhgO